ncbi:MAG: hypothetical protein ACRDRJ_34435 [Streptosporangiaceae bacterium]
MALERRGAVRSADPPQRPGSDTRLNWSSRTCSRLASPPARATPRSAMMEGFFGTLKIELIDLRRWHDAREV